jgi:LmbE family N-acetylglucosaminyl deacetylase
VSDPIDSLLAAKRVLCVQPHYDDNDLGAGGTLAALADAGAEIHYLTVTDDLMGVLDPGLSDEDARAQLLREQEEAGRTIGVHALHSLDLPDAGEWDYVALRRAVILHIRRLRADCVFTVDPWLPHEAHRDHTRVGHAVAEAAILYGLPRIRTTPEVDGGYTGHDLRAAVFYFTIEPNSVFDIGQTRERKHRALDAYRAQFTPRDLGNLHRGLDAMEERWAADEPFSHGEALKILHPGRLHVGLVPD